MRPIIRQQILYPDSVDDADIVIPRKLRARKKGEPFTKEWQLQAACVVQCAKREREDEDFIWKADLREGHRTAERASIAKMMGLRPGPSDLMLFRRTRFISPPNTGKLKIAWVELKLPKRGMTDAQWRWQEWFAGIANVECHRCESLDQFKRILAAF